MRTASTGFSVAACATALWIAAATSSAPATTRRAKGAITAVGRLAARGGGVARLEGVGGGGAEQVDRIGEARFARQERPQSCLRLLAHLRQLQACRGASVSAEDSEPACVGDDADAPPARERLAREQRGALHQRLPRPAAGHAGA